MTATLEVYWSFRSTYCHLALDRILALPRTHDLRIDLRPVYPLAIRRPQFFASSHRNHLRYHTHDSLRMAEYLGIPMRYPRPDPIVQDMETGEIATEQPYIFRLTRLGMAAVMAERGLEFLDSVSRLLWDGSVDGWNEGDHLARALDGAGLDLAALDHAIADDLARYDAAIAANERALEDAGHWGVPVMVFDREPFFGQDRLEILVWRMEQKGVCRRGSRAVNTASTTHTAPGEPNDPAERLP